MKTTTSKSDSGGYKKSTLNERPLASPPNSSLAFASASIPQKATSKTGSSASNDDSLVDPANIITDGGSRLRKRPPPALPQPEPGSSNRKEASKETDLRDGKQIPQKSALSNYSSHLFTEERKSKTNFIPVRDYYHPGSFQKFTRACFEKDTDSADECDDDQWREKVQIFNIHDFIDSNLDEKNWMILWNVYIQAIRKKSGVIRRKHVPRVCLEFVQEKAKTIQERGLQDMLMLHLSNLVDSGLISADHLHICMVNYHDVVSKS